MDETTKRNVVKDERACASGQLCGIARSRTMKSGKALLGLALLLAIPAGLLAAPATGGNSILIVFKDGPQQTYSIADLDRIEFQTPTRTASLSGANSFVGKRKVCTRNAGTL